MSPRCSARWRVARPSRAQARWTRPGSSPGAPRDPGDRDRQVRAGRAAARADAAGLTSVHVNRMMQERRAGGVIVMANRTMTLPDVASLRRVGGFDPQYLHIR